MLPYSKDIEKKDGDSLRMWSHIECMLFFIDAPASQI